MKEEKRNNNKTRRIEYSQKENECRLQSIQLAGPRPKTVDASRLKRRPRSSWATTLSPCPQLVREHSTHPPVAFPPGVTVSSGWENYSSPLGWPSTGIVASKPSRLRALPSLLIQGYDQKRSVYAVFREMKRGRAVSSGGAIPRVRIVPGFVFLRAILKPGCDYFVS